MFRGGATPGFDRSGVIFQAFGTEAIGIGFFDLLQIFGADNIIHAPAILVVQALENLSALAAILDFWDNLFHVISYLNNSLRTRIRLPG